MCEAPAWEALTCEDLECEAPVCEEHAYESPVCEELACVKHQYGKHRHVYRDLSALALYTNWCCRVQTGCLSQPHTRRAACYVQSILGSR